MITSRGQTLVVRSVIAATGAFNRLHFPQLEGQQDYVSRVLHSSEYESPTSFEDQRVLVIGAGNSAVQIATELAQTIQVTLTSREPVWFKPQRILGRDVHFWIRITGIDTWKRQFPQWHPSEIRQQGVLDTGVYQAAFKSGNPLYHPFFSRFTEQGVQWANGETQAFDAVIFATGFRPNLSYLEPLTALDLHGNALHSQGVSTTTAGLYYVGLLGQGSFSSPTLRGVGADAAYVVRNLNGYLKNPTVHPVERCCFKPQPAL